MRRTKLKKNTILLFLALFSIFLIFANFSSAGTPLLGGTLSLSALKYEPYPAEPGQYVTLWVNVFNSAATSNAVECALEPSFPFSLDANDSGTRNVGQLLVGQSVVLKYKLRVDAKAVFGDNEISFKCRSKPGDWTSTKFSITVRPKDVVVSVTKIETEPLEIEPGKEALVKIHVKNQASSSVRDLALKIDLSSPSIPLAFVKSGSEQRLQYLSAGEEKILEFNVTVAPDAASKLYKTALLLSYVDEAGNKYSREDSIAFLVNSKPELSVELESSEIIRAGQTGKIVIKIANKGLSDAKFLSTTLLPSPGFQTLSAANVYVGGLDSDDYQTIQYSLYVPPNAGSQVKLPLEVSFKDANNRQYKEKLELSLRLYSEEEITRMDLEKKSGLNLILIAIIALVTLYVLWRLFKWLSRKKRA